MQPTETALVVRIPEAEEVVGPLRARLDPAAALGVPAHVTVLAPFVPPAGLGDEVRATVAGAVASVPAFEVTFADVAWFGQQVLYLAPEPAGPFTALTRAVWRAFPGYPPYRGAYEEVVPHLTIGMGGPLAGAAGLAEAAGLSGAAGATRPAEPAGLAEAAQAVGPGLPVRSLVRSVTLMQGSLEQRSWRIVAEFPLGPARTS